MDYEWAGCYGSASKTVTKVIIKQALTFAKTAAGKDIALLTVKDEEALWPFGYLTVEDAVPYVGQTMWIAGHPLGWKKRLSIYEKDTSGDEKRCKVTWVSSDETKFKYVCDTEGGNSGSPVMKAGS